MRRLQFLLFAAFVAGFTTTTVAASRVGPTRYEITALGNPPGLGPFLPNHINNHGEIAGLASPADDDGYDTRPLLYRRGTFTDLKSRLPAEYAYAVPLAFTDHGKVLITTYTGVFFLVDDSGVEDFRDLVDGRELWPAAINNRGQIAGAGRAPDGSWQAFVYSDGEVQFLGGLPGGNPRKRSEALSISDRGLVVGVGYGGPIAVEAAFFPGHEAVGLGHFIGNGILEVNRRGEIAGATFPGTGARQRAFLWHDGITTFLPFADEFHSTVFAINDRSDIVGTYQSALDDGPGPRAFLYSQGVIHNLNDLIGGTSGWTLTYANDINEHGEIVGYGVFNGESQGFLLRPGRR
jgi:probable HAF family extracellular repeat protein